MGQMLNSPREMTTTFITSVTDGEFDKSEECIHSDGPLEGTGELLMFFSIVFTQFLLQFLLSQVPTDISDLTVVEHGSQTAEVHAEITVPPLVTVEMELELRPESHDRSDSPTPVKEWRVWDANINL